MTADDADSEEARLFCNTLLEALNSDDKQQVSGFIIIPGSSEVKFFQPKNSFDTNSLRFKPAIRRAVNYRLKTMGCLEVDTIDIPQIGYFYLNVGPYADFIFLVQTRPTRIGEELMVRMMRKDDLTVPK